MISTVSEAPSSEEVVSLSEAISETTVSSCSSEDVEKLAELREDLSSAIHSVEASLETIQNILISSTGSTVSG